MPHEDVDMARACAELIRAWHGRYGITGTPPWMREDALAGYRDRVGQFREADLSVPKCQEEIAREQKAGAFEWSCSVRVPLELWQEVSHTRRVLDQPPPRYLGEAADWIRQRFEALSRPTIQATTREELLQEAETFYAEVAAEQTSAVGGVAALLSCSLERSRWRQGIEGRVTLLSAEALGLKVVKKGERPEDLIDALRQGELVVEGVIGGPSRPIPDSCPHGNVER